MKKQTKPPQQGASGGYDGGNGAAGGEGGSGKEYVCPTCRLRKFQCICPPVTKKPIDTKSKVCIHSKKMDNWENEFKKKFLSFPEDNILDGFATDEIISFIKALLAQQRRELRERIKKLKSTSITSDEYDNALDDVLELLG